MQCVCAGNDERFSVSNGGFMMMVMAIFFLVSDRKFKPFFFLLCNESDGRERGAAFTYISIGQLDRAPSAVNGNDTAGRLKLPEQSRRGAYDRRRAGLIGVVIPRAGHALPDPSAISLTAE